MSVLAVVALLAMPVLSSGEETMESGQVALEGTGQALLNNPHVKAAYLGG